MKKLLALLLSASLALTACSPVAADKRETKNSTEKTQLEDTAEESVDDDQTSYTMDSEEYLNQFTSLDDPALLQCVSDEIYATLEADLNSDDYIVQDVNAVYISKEYLEEVAYNSQSNIFFGYTLAEIEEQFDGGKYVFTVGDDDQTLVQEFEDYDDTYEQVAKNVAIGTGVILVCVTVSVATGGAGAPAVSMIFAASAKTGTIMALSSAGIGGVASGIVKGIQTKDFDEAKKAAALSASEGFKWGAITGVITGGFSKALEIKKAANAAQAAAETAEEAALVGSKIPTPREAELLALEKYGGTEQVSYLAGKEVAMNTPGATRPDIIRQVGDHLEAIEVKNYNLESSASRNTLLKELSRQVTQRAKDLPEGTTQRIVLNTQGRGYSENLVNEVVQSIRDMLKNVGPNIPIDIMG